MDFIVNTVYTIFIAFTCNNLLHVRVKVTKPTSIHVQHLINRENAMKTIPLLSLFLVDWIVFIVLFSPTSTTGFNLTDIILFVLYLPSLVCLGFASILSLENTNKFSLYAGLYHLFAIIGELAWIVIRLSKLDNSVEPLELAKVVGVVGTYVALRFAMAYLHINIHKIKLIKAEIVVVLALILKPCFIFFSSVLSSCLVEAFTK